jgi:hypothetical protein
MRVGAKPFSPERGRGRGKGRRGIVASVLVALIAVFAVSLVLAPGAGAERSVLGFIEPERPPFPDKGPSQTTVRGFRVRDSAAAADTGDLYVAGNRHTCDQCTSTDGGFVEQLSPSGQVLRLWGPDVVGAGGPDNANETQAVRVSAGSGSFTLSFGGDTTSPPLQFNAEPSVVEAELNALPSIGSAGGSVNVSGGPGDPGGGSPYLVTFDGGALAGVDQPLVVADDAGLSGHATVYTTNPGDTGFEVCEVASGADSCTNPVDRSTGLNNQEVENPVHSADRPGALGSNPGAVAINQDSGDIYVISALRRINRYSAQGRFISSFGFDVVRQGPDDSNVDGIQRLVITAPSGSYKLSLFISSVDSRTTDSIPVGASAAQVKAALDALPALSNTGGSVSVSGPDGGPYTITFDGGSAGGDEWNRIEPVPSSAGDATTLQHGGAAEVCKPDDACKFGGGGSGGPNGAIETEGSFRGLAVAPPGTPNQGDVLVAGSGAAVTEFSSAGEFVRSFGFGVVDGGAEGTGTLTVGSPIVSSVATTSGAFAVGQQISGAGIPAETTIGSIEPGKITLSKPATASGAAVALSVPAGPDNVPGFEVCKAGSGDLCSPALQGTGLGQFEDFRGPRSITEDASGAIFTVDGRRVQKFTPAGGLDLTPPASPFGVNDTQQLAVNAGAGQYRLSAVGLRDTTGMAHVTPHSPLLTEVTTSTGVFQVGQRIFGGNLIPPGVTIAAIGPGTITMSRPLPEEYLGLCDVPGNHCLISANRLYTTPDLPYNASPTEVQNAINALPPIAAEGSPAHVTGGLGDPGANNPYTITFEGGAATNTDFAQLDSVQGTTPLSGGSGAGANQARVSTLQDGGPSQRFTGVSENGKNDEPFSVAALPNGSVAINKKDPELDSPCPSGSPFDRSFSIGRIRQFAPDGSAQEEASPPPCAIDPGYYFEGQPAEPVGTGSSLSVDPSSGEIYSDFGKRVYIYGEAGEAPELVLDPVSGVSSTGATLSGSIDPNGVGPIDHPNPSTTSYIVEYREVGETDWTPYVSKIPVGSGSSPIPFSIGIGGLAPKTTYEARVLVIKPFGFAPQIQTTAPFQTLVGKPKVASPYADIVTSHSAELHGQVNPSGADTTYHFEYGPTTAYDHSTPAVDIGDGISSLAVQAHIDGLDPVVQHFRLVATNSAGTDTGEDQSFNFYPEPCPNSAARQQTGSDLLPDCRAYEMVSPNGLGSTVLLAQGPSSSLATSPPRFAYAGGAGTLPGPWNPPNNGTGDTYVATRTDQGWQTSFVGIPAQDASQPGGAPGGSITNFGAGGILLPGDDGLDRFLQWGPNSAQSGDNSSPPRLFDAQGNELGRLPSNLAAIPGGDLPPGLGGWAGDQRLSGDGHHFIFSSNNTPFAAGGLSSGAGSVYDDDIATGSVALISKTEAGADIPQVPGAAHNGHPLLVPGASSDGSHVLIGAPVDCPPSLLSYQYCPGNPLILYMSVDDTTHYDVSRGQAVDFEGMSRDGTEVFFSSDQHLSADDHDSSTDLFRWSEAGNTITRVSAGTSPVGDTDACSASWIAGCGARAVPHDNHSFTNASTDNAVSASGNAVYFYAPEQLSGAEGFPGRRNLYAYRNGEVHFVASLDADKPASRIQVSADGRYAAFITKSRLSGYDNAGHAEMYLYDDATGKLVCASCIPDGSPPSHDAQGSTDGIFMSDDGHAFFTTLDSLTPRDADGLPDVYEYTEGRPQLITTGVAAQGNPSTGLVGVSADGVDVYFLTLDTLVPQDHNGPFLKFYDARAGGGFPVAPEILPCAAAEECHGPGNAAPSAPSVSSSADLGGAGNSPRSPQPCRKGKVRRHGRCVAKPKEHHHKHRKAKHGRSR